MQDKNEQAPDLGHQEQFKRLKKNALFLWITVLIQSLVIIALNIRIFKIVYLLELLSERIGLVSQNTSDLAKCVTEIFEVVKAFVG